MDLDPQALEATQYNATRNAACSPQFRVSLPDALGDQQVDLLIANILAKPLMEMATCFEKLIKPQGKILLSGILADQVNAVFEVYQAAFLMQPPVYKGEWARLEGERK